MSQRNLEEIFKINYLTSVSCEIRFTPLMIIKDKVAEFQKEIRNYFPNIQKGIFPISGFEFNEWIFHTNDNRKKIIATTDRLGVITTTYNDFKPFFEMVTKNIGKFFEIITDIDNVSRIGMRYTNEIPLDKDNPIKDILNWFNPTIYEDKINNLKPIAFSSEIRIIHEANTLTSRNNFSLIIGNSPKYIIDIDSYTEKEIETENINSIIIELHKLAIKEFHNNIKDEFLQILRGKK